MRRAVDRVLRIVVERLKDASAVVRPPGAEIDRCRRAHDQLHHVRRNTVVDEPCRVGVAEFVKAEPAGVVPRAVLHGLRLQRDTAVSTRILSESARIVTAGR
jgi:hypothetical protein